MAPASPVWPTATTESVSDSLRAAEELARMSSDLQRLVGTFRV